MQDIRPIVPAALKENVIALCGEKGRSWLAELPRLIANLEDNWSVQAEDPFPAVEFNYVARAVRLSDGQKVVLKIAPPVDNNEIFSEARFLSSRNGRSCIRIFGLNRDARAMLIERAVPGTSFADYFEGREEECVAPAIGLLASILEPAPVDLADTISLDDWFAGLNCYEESDFPAVYASRALETYERLSKQEGRACYLHGDFHPGNLVVATREPCQVIDPKGIIGHIGYEIAVFLNNFHWWQAESKDLRLRLDRAVTQFSRAFDILPGELREWAFAQMVLSAWWTFDEMGGLYNNDVAKADIWDIT